MHISCHDGILLPPRGIDVLLNAESQRETPAMVSFDDKQRHIGVLAAGKVGPGSGARSGGLGVLAC